MRNTKYVSAVTVGNKLDDDKCVVLALYGPRGGTRAIETLSRDAANKLAWDILEATKAIDRAEK
jgi:hypothetical protein